VGGLGEKVSRGEFRMERGPNSYAAVKKDNGKGEAEVLLTKARETKSKIIREGTRGTIMDIKKKG